MLRRMIVGILLVCFLVGGCLQEKKMQTEALEISLTVSPFSTIKKSGFEISSRSIYNYITMNATTSYFYIKAPATATGVKNLDKSAVTATVGTPEFSLFCISSMENRFVLLEKADIENGGQNIADIYGSKVEINATHSGKQADLTNCKEYLLEVTVQNEIDGNGRAIIGKNKMTIDFGGVALG